MENGERHEVFNSANLLEVANRNWKPLLTIGIIAFVVSVIVAYCLPEKYKATVSVFATSNNNLSRAFLSEKAGDSKDYLAFGEELNAEQVLQVFKSDELMFALEKRYNLLKYYELADDKNKWYLFRGCYSEYFSYEITQYESILVTVYDKNPQHASDMANGAEELADSIYRQIVKQRAIAAYKVVKSQYDSTLAVANKLQDSLSFFRNQGILAWDYQVKELTSGYADALIKGNAEAVKTLSDKLKAFEQYGKGFSMITHEADENFEWLNQVKRSYMQAKVNAEQTIPAMFVADKAVPADNKTYPIRSLVVAGGTIIALFFGLLIILFMNSLNSVKKK